MSTSVQLAAAAPWKIASPEALLLLTLVPLLAIGVWAAFLRQRRALAIFSGSTPQDSRPSTARALARLALLVVGLSTLIVAIARPQADPIEEESTTRGRDIAFLVDVSRSMLSRDVVPSRLERAKLWIKDLTGTLRGDRVSLVAFAGIPVVQCPLTLDYGFFQMSLDELSPASSPRGGTLIGDAIRKTLSDVFEPGANRFRDIILITDGEDQGSFPVQAAQKAGEMGVRIIAIGIGSELQGAPVPAKDAGSKAYLEYEGQEVRSRMDSSTLAQITAAAAQARGDAAGGVFLNVGTGTIDLDQVYRDLIASAEQRETLTQPNVVYRELFPIFLVIALVCLACEPLIPLRVRKRQPIARAVPNGLLASVLVALCVPIARAQPAAPAPSSPPAAAPATPQTPPAAPDAASSYNSGRELFLAGKFSEACDAFRQADLGATDADLSGRARFNLGQALLKQATADPKADPAKTIQQLDEAARAFKGALAVDPKDAQAARNVEIARRLMRDAQRQQSEQQQQSGQGDKNKQDQQSKDQQKQDQQKQDKSGQQSTDKNSKEQQSKEAQEHQDNADAMKDLAKRQDQAADKSGQAKEQRDQAAKDAKTQESKADQESVNKDTKKEQERLDSSKSTSQDARQKLDQAQKEQQAASQALDKGDPKSAQDHQHKAADLLKEAAQAEQSAADKAKQSAQQAKEPEPKHDETASQLLDKERKQREARQQILRALKGRAQPVDKDW